MNNNTEKILDSLSDTKSITAFLEENKEAFNLLNIGEYMELEIEKRDLVKADVIKASGINKRYFNEIIAGKKRPHRSYIIRMFLSVGLDFVDAQWYLKACEYSQLFVKTKRDSIIIYCLDKKLPVVECNKMLNKIGLENLG